MAVDHFIPVIWAAEILETFQTANVIASVVNTDYEGEITGQGSSVKISSIGEITVADYTKNSTSLTVQKLQSSQTILNIDTAKYFAFEIDDIDKAQANVNFMPAAMKKAAYALAKVADTALGLLYSEAAHTVTDATCDSLLIYNTIAEAKQKLDEAGVPDEGRWMVLAPWVISKLILAKLLTTEGSVNADGTYANGMVGNVLGFAILKSNGLYQTGTAPDYTTHCMAGVREAISFAEQIVKVEGYRPEDHFTDAVKGLHVYGMKVVQPQGLVQLVLTYSAETT